MKRTVTSPKDPGKNFLAALSRVIRHVGSFGESFIAHLVQGVVVSDDLAFSEIADVIIENRKIGIQVKMCNKKHAHRPSAHQIQRLYEETKDEIKFVVDIVHGVYAFVFYNGIHTGVRDGKSKLLSRKIPDSRKSEIIANELQYVYFVDIDLLQHLATSEHFDDVQRMSDCKIHSKEKLLRHHKERVVLYLNRMFLRSFMKDLPERLRKALDDSLGVNQWEVKEKVIDVLFEGELGEFSVTLPLRFIGKKKTNKLLLGRILSSGKVVLRQNSNQATLASFAPTASSL